MRYLLCGAAAIALSGCSWMGFGSGQNYNSGSTYTHNTSNDECCVGGKTLSRWNMEAGIGAETFVSGNAISGSKSPPALFPLTTLQDVKMSDAYAVGYRAELGGSYALNPNRKLTLQGTYSQFNGNEVAWGQQGGGSLRGTMSDYKSYGIEAGIRQYARPKRFPILKSVRPYIEGKMGVAYVDDIRLENINQVGGVPHLSTPASLAFYQASWVPTASGLIGIETPVFDRFTMGLETGIRYSGTQGTDTTDTGGGFNARYSGANNGGDRWSVPLTIRGRYRF